MKVPTDVVVLLLIFCGGYRCVNGGEASIGKENSTVIATSISPNEPTDLSDEWIYVKSCDCQIMDKLADRYNVSDDSDIVSKIVENLDELCSSAENETSSKAFLQGIYICSLHGRYVPENFNVQALDDFMEHYIRHAFHSFCSANDGGARNGTDERSSKERIVRKLFQFLFKKDDHHRTAVCNALYQQELESRATCDSKGDDTIDGRCRDASDPYAFNWNAFSAFVDVYMVNQSHHSEAPLLFNDEVYETDLESWSERFANFISNNSRFRNVHKSVMRSKVYNNELVQNFLASTLMQNNFGRALRQTQHTIKRYCVNANASSTPAVDGSSIEHLSKKTSRRVRVECNETLLHLRDSITTVVAHRFFEPLLNAERWHNTLHVLLVVIAFVINLYVLILLWAYKVLSVNSSVGFSSSSSVTVTRCLLVANLLFVVANVWLLLAQRVSSQSNSPPEAAGDKSVEFPALENFDGDFLLNATYFVNVETLRVVSVTGTPQKEEESRGGGDEATRNIDWYAPNVAVVLNNLLLDSSRTFVSTAIFLVTCAVLYDLRTSFCGRIGDGTAAWLRILIVIYALLMAAFYALVGLTQLSIITKINQMVNGASNPKSYEAACVALNNTYTRERYMLKGHLNFTIVFFVATICANFALFAYHKYKEFTSPLHIPVTIKGEMRSSFKSLLLSTAVHVLTNLGLVYVQIAITNSDCVVDGRCVSRESLRYHWLYLIALLDAVVQPLIVVWRTRAIRRLHAEAVATLTMRRRASAWNPLMKCASALPSLWTRRERDETRATRAAENVSGVFIATSTMPPPMARTSAPQAMVKHGDVVSRGAAGRHQPSSANVRRAAAASPHIVRRPTERRQCVAKRPTSGVEIVITPPPSRRRNLLADPDTDDDLRHMLWQLAEERRRRR